MRRLVDALKKAVDPTGVVGEFLSPSEVYKSRIGLPVSSPHVQRVQMQAPAHIDQALAAPRFVTMAEATSVPRDRVRQVSAFVEEHWAPAYRRTVSTDIAEILRASQDQIGWTVTQRQSQTTRARAPVSAEQFQEIAQSLQIQASDEFYNGIMETVPGSDPIVLDGEVLRGEATYDADGKMTHDGIVRGTVITRGRSEYNERTKGMVTWDKGFLAQREAALREEASRPVRNVAANLDRVRGEVLPMRRLLANPIRDRRSAC